MKFNTSKYSGILNNLIFWTKLFEMSKQFYEIFKLLRVFFFYREEKD